MSVADSILLHVTGWRTYRLEELVNPSSGAWGEDIPHAGRQAVTVLGVGNVTNEGNLVVKGATTRYLSKDELCAVAYEGDLLVVKSSGSASNIRSGKTAICPPALSGSIACSNFMYKLTVDSSKANPYLLWLLLNGEQARSFIKTIVGASTYPNIKWEQYKNFEVSLPPLPDQRQIAARLKAQLAEVETARQALQMQLRDAALLRQRLLRQTFDALADESHKVLGDCCKFYSGGTPEKGKTDFWNGEIPWFSPKDIKSFELVSSQDRITETAVQDSATRLVMPGTILVVSRSGVLAHTLPVGIVRQSSTFNQDIKGIIPNDDFDPEYVALYLVARQSSVVKEGVKRGPTVHSLIAGFIESLEIPDVLIDTQRRIVTTLKQQLAEVDRLRTALEQQLRDVDALPQRILAQAFSREKHTK